MNAADFKRFKSFKLYLTGIETIYPRQADTDVDSFKLYLTGIETVDDVYTSKLWLQFKLYLTGIETELTHRHDHRPERSNCTLLELKRRNLENLGLLDISSNCTLLELKPVGGGHGGTR